MTQQHRNWRRHLLTGSIVLGILAGAACHNKNSAAIADPLRLHFVGLPAEVQDKVGAMVPHPNKSGVFDVNRVGRSSYYFLTNTWAESLFVHIPAAELPKLQKVDITIGERDYSVSGNDVRSWDQSETSFFQSKNAIAQGDLALRVPGEFGQSSSLPWVSSPVMNWPGDAAYLRQVVQNALLPCVLVLLVSWWWGKAGSEPGRVWCRKVLGFDAAADIDGAAAANTPAPYGARLAGFLFLVAALAFLEVRQPFYFTQDDNATESLPMILVGCRSLWRGEFPHYNPYLFLGSPLANLGMYALTYPPMLLSYGVARHLLGQEYATLEVFAILHILAGFCIIRMLGHKLGMGALPANLTALSCVLAGSTLIMGRSWFNFVPIVVWLPLLFLGLVHLVGAVAGSWKWIVGMGLSMAMPFHVGFSQAAICINGFFCLAVAYLFVRGALPKRKLVPVLAALLIGAGLALPLVYQQWLLSQDARRSPGEVIDQGIAIGLPAMLLPYPFVRTELPTGWGNAYRDYLGQFYFFGGLLAWLFFFHVTGKIVFGVWCFVFRGDPPNTKHQTPNTTHGLWTFCALIALWLGLGSAGGLWLLIAWLPKVGFINRYPLRLMPFIGFFAAIVGGLALERLLKTASQRQKIACGLAGGGLLLWHVVLCLPAFYLYRAPIYPVLPDGLQTMLWDKDQLTGRVVSWASEASSDENFFALLPQDVPAVYELPVQGGYNPLLAGKRSVASVEAARNPWPAMQAYGVRWHFIPDRPPPLSSVYAQNWRFEVTSPNDPRSLELVPSGVSLRQVFAGDGYIVKELTPADPLAFPVDDEKLARIPGASLPVELHGGGINVDVRTLRANQLVIVNFRHMSDMAAYLDGDGPIDCRRDGFERIVVRLPRAGEELSIRYRPPWARGIWLGLATAGLGLACAVWYRLRFSAER